MVIPITNTAHCIQWEFSNRNDGDMRSEENIKRFLYKNNMDENSYILAQQIHDTEVRVVNQELKRRKITGVDGLISSLALCNSQDITLVIRTADCVPVLFYDDSTGVIGCAHSGWKGTYGNIVKNVVAEMINQGAKREFINVILGPHIRSCCYSVDTPRGESFLHRYGEKSSHKEGAVYYLHLEDVIFTQLKEIGIMEQNIASSTQCTSTHNETYFSYRKDSLTTFGEQIAIVGLKKVKF